MRNAVIRGLFVMVSGILCAEHAEHTALWTGSWEYGKNLVNRGDLRFSLPFTFALRAEAVDRRPEDITRTGFHAAGFGESGKEGLTSFSGGLYHNATGSRFLWGILDEWGLPARIRNPWIRSLPFAENRKPSMADLETDPSSTKDAEAYLYLGSPSLEFFRDSVFRTAVRGFASVQVDTAMETGFGGGLDFRFGKKNVLSLEGFYTGGTLSQRKSGTWFSESPPLPERDFRLYAAGFFLDTPFLAAGSDWAFSDTWAYGRDVYGNLGIWIGNFLPFAGGTWRLSFAADGAGNRYTGRDGSNPGAAFRSGGKFEWKGKRNSLFRASTSLRAPALGEKFNRSSSAVYVRFPPPPAARSRLPGAAGNFPARIARFSLEAARDGRDAAKILDSMDGSLSLSLNVGRGNAVPPLGITLSGSVAGTAAEGWISPYPAAAGHRFDSARAGWEFLWSPSGKPLRIPGTFQFRTRAGYTARDKKDPFWDFSFSTALRFRYGRLSVKIAAGEISERKPFPDPGTWDYTLSWNLRDAFRRDTQ
ncbi:MAG: hypothetical protein LBI86_06120 [Treponema sp.]|jgi:hypothetical protein|nr:hypothetical protein [Treponema sp.]